MDQAKAPAESEPVRTPEKSLAEWLIAVLLFVLSIGYLWPFRNYTALNADEGIVLQGAQNILNGEVLYRDFFAFVTPGSYYWVAFLFRLFGNSILVARTMLLVYGGLFSVLTYFVARRVSSRWSAVFAAYLSLVACLPYRFLVLHNWDSTLAAYLALYCAVWWWQTSHRLWVLGCGSFISLAFLSEQSKGVGLLVGLLLALFGLSRTRSSRGILDRSSLPALLAGLGWPVAATLAFFHLERSLPETLAAWVWPLRHYTTANRLPYGYVVMSLDNWGALYSDPSWARRVWHVLLTSPFLVVPILPFLSLAFFASHAWALGRNRQPQAASGYYVLVSGVSTGLVLGTCATRRPDFTHLLYIAPPLFLALAWILGAEKSRLAALFEARPLLATFLLVFFTTFGLILLWKPLNARQRLETRRGVLKASDPDPLLPYVQAHVAPGERIFIYPYQPLYYYLTATTPLTRFEYLQPGMHTSAQFREAVSELAADPSRVVLYDLSFTSEKIPQAWPSTPPSLLASDPVRDYLFSHYRVCRAFSSTEWKFESMVRRDLACPNGPVGFRQDGDRRGGKPR